MPIYEFFCRTCKKDFDIVESVTEHDRHGQTPDRPVRCPHCQGTDIERRWSSVFAVTSKKS
jgi:putative FmdB family regulatory protein